MPIKCPNCEEYHNKEACPECGCRVEAYPPIIIEETVEGYAFAESKTELS